MPFNVSEKMIQGWSNHYIDQPFRNVRIHWENEARAMLNAYAGQFTDTTFRQWCFAWNQEYIANRRQSNPSHTRFGTGHGTTIQITTRGAANLASFNAWIFKAWNGPIPASTIIPLEFDCLKQQPFSGGNIFLFSLILYLRDPERYNVCTSNLAFGLAQLADGRKPSKLSIKSGDDYLAYNANAMELRKQFGMAPQDVDFIAYMGDPKTRQALKAEGFFV